MTASIGQRLRREDGVALIVALMATMLLTGLGMTLMLLSNTETQISSNYRNSQEGLYAADAAVERIVQDLLLIPRWNDILSGATECAGTMSSFIDNACSPNVTATIPATGQTVNLGKATRNLQAATDAANLWLTNNPKWRLFAYGPIANLLTNITIDSQMYVAVWIADDPADSADGVNPDGNAQVDSNGTVTVHAEAFGPAGTHKIIEVTVARTSSTEIERGQIAQRGQDELNQRARKAAVQTPGKALSNMSLDTSSGGLVVH